MGTKRVRSHPPALRDLSRGKVKWNPNPQNPVQHHFKAQCATGVERGQPWRGEIRKASCWVGLEGGRMTDKAQCAYLLYDLVPRSNHKPQILFHLPSRD